MEDVLARMKAEKRIRVINSALKEFGANSFEKASTNTIVKDAGISKGLLYHYFESKDALYEYLLIFTMERMGNAILEGIDWEDGDLINRMHTAIRIKLEILEQYPYLMDFGKTMYDGKTMEEIKALVEQHIPDLYNKMYSYNIDYSLFKENLDVKRVITMIQLFLDGFSEKIASSYKNMTTTAELRKEFDELMIYLEMYKEAFYKKE